MIEWKRIAEPQEDGYDTRAILRASKSNALPHFKKIKPLPNANQRTLFFDNQVSIQHVHKESPYTGLVNAPLAHPNIALAAEYVRLWPAVFHQFQALIRCFHPLMTPVRVKQRVLASSSGCQENEFGVIYATVEHPMTLAEALVHEMAHHKLFALGVGIDKASRLINNPPDVLYVSPVIKDRRRPMTAVFHAEYSFAHILHLDLLMLKAKQDHTAIDMLLQLLAYTLSAVAEGFDEVRTYIKVDRAGRRFVDGFLPWADRLIQQGETTLDQYYYKQRQSKAAHGR